MEYNFEEFKYTLIDKNLTIEVNLPENLEICNTTYGQGIFAKENFKEGEIIWRMNQIFLRNEDFNDKITLNTNKGQYILDKLTHCSGGDKTNDTLIVYSFDAYVNHSCNPNTRDEYYSFEKNIYQTIAMRDIKKGEQITCNYNSFYYLIPEFHIFNCQCGASNCAKIIKGYKYLSLEDKKEISKYANKEHFITILEGDTN